MLRRGWAVGAFPAGFLRAVPLIVSVAGAGVAAVALFFGVALFAGLWTWVFTAIPDPFCAACAAVIGWWLYFTGVTTCTGPTVTFPLTVHAGAVRATILKGLGLSIFTNWSTGFLGADPGSIGITSTGVAAVTDILSRPFFTGLRSFITGADIATAIVLLVAEFTGLSALFNDGCVTCATGTS